MILNIFERRKINTFMKVASWVKIKQKWYSGITFNRSCKTILIASDFTIYENGRGVWFRRLYSVRFVTNTLAIGSNITFRW